jgi:hypothetical protein
MPCSPFSENLHLYFLTGGRFGTKYHELHPGVVTTMQVQEEIIQDLVANDVQTVVLSKEFREEPNDSQYDNKVDLLDRHIRNSYAQVADLSKYSVWKKVNTTSTRSVPISSSRQCLERTN